MDREPMDKEVREKRAIGLLIRKLRESTGREYRIEGRPEHDGSRAGTYDFDVTDGTSKLAVEIVDLFRHEDFNSSSAAVVEIKAQYDELFRGLSKELGNELPGTFVLHGMIPKISPPKPHAIEPVVEEIRREAKQMQMLDKKKLGSVPFELFKWMEDGNELIPSLFDAGKMQQPWDVEDFLLSRRNNSTLLGHKDEQLSPATTRVRVLLIHDPFGDSDGFAVQEAIANIQLDRPTEIRYTQEIYFASADECYRVWPRPKTS